MILFEKFRFTRNGHVTISVQKVLVKSISNINTDPSRLGFLLLLEESLLQVLMEIQQNNQFYVLDSYYFNHSYPVTAPNEYSPFFANCTLGTSITRDVQTEVYNLDCNGSRDYLSASCTQLPSLFFLFSLVCLAFLGFWIYNLYTNKRSVHRIHFLMGGMLLMKALNLICATEDKHYVKVIGTPHVWDVLFHIFQFIRVILLFTVIILIGTGWSFFKPFLQEKEKNVLMIVIPLQVIANFGSVVIGETGPFYQGLGHLDSDFLIGGNHLFLYNLQNRLFWNHLFLFFIFIISCYAL
ncbi:hypothetical protein UlMin_036906 [Ulmus minor]